MAIQSIPRFINQFVLTAFAACVLQTVCHAIEPGSYPAVFEDRVYSEEIHTVMLRNSSWELSLPIIESGNQKQLELQFDDLTTQSRNYGYTLVLCNADWKPSDLQTQEYLSGYGTGNIRDYSNSFNTLYGYVHYRLVFPEEDCMPVLPGNYALVVFDEANPDKIILTRRLYIIRYESAVDARMKQPEPLDLRETSQQVEFTVTCNNNDIRDPLNEVTAVAYQNSRPDRMLLLNPFSADGNRLQFNNPAEGIFPGGNEFRSLDIKSMKYQTENLSAMVFQKPYWHVFMKPDENRAYKPYFSKPDLNGGFFIDYEGSNDKNTSADYVFVHFNLSGLMLGPDDRIFVTGGFCDWTCQQSNQMLYNENTNNFEVTLLLKQGLYDYCFAKAKSRNGPVDESEIEGSYYETQNSYTLFVYFHDRFKGNDRLIGYQQIR
jgi:hypothetical protein